MTTAYETRRVVRASPKRLFEAWLDSREHSDMTGAAAEITSKEGEPFSTLDGQITGVNVEIGSYNRIVQRWHVSLPEGGTAESRIEWSLATGQNYGGIGFPHDDGTTIIIHHSGLPSEQTRFSAPWWEEFYFQPMDVYFATGNNRFTRPSS